MRKSSLFLIVMFVFITGCTNPSAIKDQVTPTADLGQSTPTQILPTDIPYVIKVNDLGITSEEYASDLARYQNADSSSSPEVAAEVVQTELINELLLAGAAYQNGYSQDDASIDRKIEDLKAQMGGSEAFDAWINAQGYTQDNFRSAYKLAAAAAWMRDKLAEETPKEAPQVHAQQILFLNEAEANNVLEQIKAGSDFATLAEQYDPITKGDLGWFPKGYLTQKVVEDAVFALQPGETSAVITSEVGYHLLQVIESSDSYPLSPGAYQAFQSQTITQWLLDQRQSSQIEINIQ